LLGFTVLLLFAACSATPVDESSTQTGSSGSPEAGAEENLLRVGVSTNAPPLIYKQAGEIVGLEAELAREFAKFLGRPLQFVELKWSDQIPALLQGRTDIIMSAMSVTKKRAIRIAFSTPYYRTGLLALVRREDRSRFPTGYSGIVGQTPSLRFGVVKGTTGEQFVRKNFGRADKIRVYDTSQEAVNALTTVFTVNRIDLLVHDGPILVMLAAADESGKLYLIPDYLTEENLAWGMRKNDLQLLESANRFIEKWKQESRLESVIKRWAPFAP
jgi:polar amino acid transport system substrate-binding protein